MQSSRGEHRRIPGLFATIGVLVSLALGASLFDTGYAVAQVNTIPREQIPSDISPTIKAAIEDLYSDSPITRGNAALRLGAMGKRAVLALPFLIALLNDRTQLRWQPQSAGRYLTSPGALAHEAIVKIGYAAVAPMIVLLQTNPDNRLRFAAAGALGQIGDSRAFEALLRAFSSDNYEPVRGAAAEALGSLNDARAVDPLVQALSQNDYWVRDGAIRALGNMRVTTAVEPLTRIVADVRSPCNLAGEAARALGKIGDARAVGRLIAALRDQERCKEYHVRVAFIEALGHLNDSQAFESLVQALKKEEDPGPRGAAAAALGKLKDDRAIVSLIEAILDKESYVQQQAAGALTQLTGEKFGIDYEKWRHWFISRK